MCISKPNGGSNFDELELKLQDEVLLKRLSSKLEEVVKNVKNSRDINFTELVSGFNLEVSIEISERSIKAEKPPQSLQFFTKSASIKKCWVYDEEAGAQILVDC